MSTQAAVARENLETRTIRKLQKRILPYIFLLYIVAFLDRINISFAALTMNKELAITSQQFGCSAASFSWAISSLKYRATCCCTRLDRGFGLPGY